MQKNLTKYNQYREKSLQRQRERFFSEENINKRKEKQKEYIKRIRDKQLQKKKETKVTSSLLPPRIKKFSSKMIELHKQDAKFYEKVWNEREHYCENCGKFLGDYFRDEKGKLICLFRYAHIITKTKYPLLRHNSENLMLLCLDCHTKFDNAPIEIVKKMPCYNKEKIEYLKNLHKSLENEK